MNFADPSPYGVMTLRLARQVGSSWHHGVYADMEKYNSEARSSSFATIAVYHPTV